MWCSSGGARVGHDVDEYLDRGKILVAPSALADVSNADVVIVDADASVRRRASQIVLRITAALPGDEHYGRLPACHGLPHRTARTPPSADRDVQQPDGDAVLRALLARADFVVANKSDLQCQRLGIDAEALHALNPRAILVHWFCFDGAVPLSRKSAVRIGESADTILEGLGMSAQAIEQLKARGVVGHTEWAKSTAAGRPPLR